MEPRLFFDAKAASARKRRGQVCVAHNFIKSALMQAYVRPGSAVLDLGCGVGGDAQKFAHLRPRAYTGLDLSAASVARAAVRLRALPCPCTFIVGDMRRAILGGPYDAVCANFSLHYAFTSEDDAVRMLLRLKTALAPGGKIVGCIPTASGAAYETVRATLPTVDARQVLEPVVTLCALQASCARAGLDILLYENFVEAMDRFSVTHARLKQRMRAEEAAPDAQNACFVLREKRHRSRSKASQLTTRQ